MYLPAMNHCVVQDEIIQLAEDQSGVSESATVSSLGMDTPWIALRPVGNHGYRMVYNVCQS